MAWEKPQGYSKEELDKAGDILIDKNSSEIQKLKATEILDNRRAIHKYPMFVFKIRLKRMAHNLDKNSLIVQRLKRSPSIIKKLERSQEGKIRKLKLSQINDIAGCRAILSDTKMAYELYQNNYLKGRHLRHNMTSHHDYIKEPKPDGYRSLHIVYSYKSDTKKTEYDGLFVEVQIRSKLQHYWATAVETAGLFTKSSIKTGEGTADWQNFFCLMSSAIALEENSHTIPNTPDNANELYPLIKHAAQKLQVINRMQNWVATVSYLGKRTEEDPKAKLFLLELNIKDKTLGVTAYRKEQLDEQKAIKDYSEKENAHKDDKDYDVVLVGADSIKELEEGYSNYFADTQAFLQIVEGIIK